MMIADETKAAGNEPAELKHTETLPPRRRGFAAMDQARVKEISSKGGKAAHAAGTAHQFNSDEARNAGRKGGMAPHIRRGGVRRPAEPSQSTLTPDGSRSRPEDRARDQ